MARRESLKMIRIGQPAAKPQTGERSTTKCLHIRKREDNKRLVIRNGRLPVGLMKRYKLNL